MTKGKNSDVLVLSDLCLEEADYKRAEGYKKIVAFLMEPRAINRAIYQYIANHIDQFDLVLTFDRSLLEQYPTKCKFVNALAPAFIIDQKIHAKSQLCSFVSGIVSTKIEEPLGYLMRHEVLKRFRYYFDYCKTDETPRTDWKDQYIDDVCFSVVIENSKASHYFTEKILDCFRAGTIPIYWGCPTIGEFFDIDGIIPFECIEDLEEILKTISVEEYIKRRSAVERNFELAKKYPALNFRDFPHLPCCVDALWPHIEALFSD